jgi:FkbM family methyltransferase
MNRGTPLRLLRAFRSPEGLASYRQSLRAWLWGQAGRLPWALRYNATLSGRLRIRLNARDQVISRSIFSTGEWEPGELRFIRSYVRPGMVALDVGANIGVHTLTIAECVGPRGAVHSFEPTGVFEALRYNVRQNGFERRVRLNHCAVGAEEGSLRLLACKPGYELFTSEGTPLVPEVSTGRYVEYPMTALDAYAREQGLSHIDFLKVDVEGAEDLVLRGAKDLIARGAVGCILFELNEVCMHHNGRSAAAFLALLRSSGYHLSMIDRDARFHPVPEDVAGTVFNIVATHEPLPLARDDASGARALAPA